jgi:hypothetical protein
MRRLMTTALALSALAFTPLTARAQKGHAAPHPQQPHVQQPHFQQPHFQEPHYFLMPPQMPQQPKQTHVLKPSLQQANTAQAQPHNVKVPHTLAAHPTNTIKQTNANAVGGSPSNLTGISSYAPQNTVHFPAQTLNFPSEVSIFTPHSGLTFPSEASIFTPHSGLTFPSEAFSFSPQALTFPSQATNFHPFATSFGGSTAQFPSPLNLPTTLAQGSPNPATALLGMPVGVGGVYHSVYHNSSSRQYYPRYYAGGYGNINQISPVQRHFDKLVHDLDSLSPRYQVAESHRIGLKNDLMAVVQGYGRPSTSVVSQLSHNLANAMTRRQSQAINTRALAEGLQVVMNSSHFNKVDVDSAIAQSQNYLREGGFSPIDIQTVGSDMHAVAGQARASLTVLR